MKRQRATETAPRNKKKRQLNGDQQQDDDLEVNDNNEGYEEHETECSTEHENPHIYEMGMSDEEDDNNSQDDPPEPPPISKDCEQDLIWDEENHDSDTQQSTNESDVEEELTETDFPRANPTTRNLRSATIAAAQSLSACNRDDVNEVLAEDESVWKMVPLTYSVDDEHRELLKEYNKSVANVTKLRKYLQDKTFDNKSLYLHMLEEAVILQRQVELDYLTNCDAYQAMNADLTSRHSYICRPFSEELLRAHRKKITKGMTVVDGKGDDGKWPVAEIVGEWIEDALKEEKDQRLPHDAEEPILPGSTTTIKSFLRDLDSTCAVYNIPHNGKIALLEWLNKGAPQVRTGIRVSKAGRNVHDCEKYLLKDWRDVSVDACPKNCILFIGENRWKIKCPCGEYRFSPCCNNSNCKTGGINCDPFETPTHNQRSSYSVLKYRQVIFYACEFEWF
jgi:hypothetical protein